MSDQHTAMALRLMNDPLSRHGRLEEVAAENPGLGLNGYGHEDDRPPSWPEDQIRRALLWLAVCEPRGRLASEGSYTLKHQAELLAGGYVSNGALICAALMCSLRVQPQTPGPNAKIALKAPRQVPTATFGRVSQRTARGRACLPTTGPRYAPGGTRPCRCRRP